MLKRVSSIITFISFFITFITFAEVVEISSWAELASINSALDGDYVLVNDLSSETEGYDDYAGSSANDGAGWLPIGNSSNPFYGSFDGQGYSISDIYINRRSHFIGLFGLIEKGTLEEKASIKNLCVLNMNVTITGSYSSIGILCGKMDASYVKVEIPIENVEVSGVIYGDGISYTGGIAGYAHYVNFQKCKSNTTITTGSSKDRIGGFVGQVFRSTLRNCYASGSVSGGSLIGGFLGLASDDCFYNCYSSTSVSGSGSYVGGFAGRTYGNDIVKEVYWDTEVSGQSSSVLGEGKTTAQMKDIDTYPLLEEQNWSGTVNAWIDWENFKFYVDWASGDKFDGLQVNDTIQVYNGYQWITCTILTYVSNERLEIDQWIEGTGLSYTALKSNYGWNIVLKQNHDGQEDTAVWFIDDGNDYPRLWFEFTGSGSGSGGEEGKKNINIIWLN